jgi:hypothetical protein
MFTKKVNEYFDTDGLKPTYPSCIAAMANGRQIDAAEISIFKEKQRPRSNKIVRIT